MPLPQINPDIWHHRAGGGCLSLFGLPFFIVGAGVIVMTFIPADVRGGDEIPLFFGIPFGSIFALIGGGLLFGRIELAIDRSSGEVTKNWQLLSKTVKAQTRQLNEFDRISLCSEIRRSKNSSYTVYPIRLAGERADRFDISQERVENTARKEAEDLAKFLSWPIHDETSGSLRIREPDSLDETIKDKFEKGLESNEIPDPPATLKSRIDYDGSNLQVEIPPPGLKAGFIVGIIAIGMFELIFISVFAVPFFSKSDLGEMGFVFMGIFALFFLGIPTLILLKLIGNAFLANQSIAVNSASLTVSKGWPRKKTMSIPRSEIEEFFIGVKSRHSSGGKAPVRFGSFKEVIAVSDRAQLSFGNGLPKEELEYVHALAKGILIS